MVKLKPMNVKPSVLALNKVMELGISLYLARNAPLPALLLPARSEVVLDEVQKEKGGLIIDPQKLSSLLDSLPTEEFKKLCVVSIKLGVWSRKNSRLAGLPDDEMERRVEEVIQADKVRENTLFYISKLSRDAFVSFIKDRLYKVVSFEKLADDRLSPDDDGKLHNDALRLIRGEELSEYDLEFHEWSLDVISGTTFKAGDYEEELYNMLTCNDSDGHRLVINQDLLNMIWDDLTGNERELLKRVLKSKWFSTKLSAMKDHLTEVEQSRLFNKCVELDAECTNFTLRFEG